ncbi:3-oxoacyl-ACP synthase [Candidatus Aerophobetes bacterium]|uniref:Beta-ketoacyl-[acyl-carrier-protein] synthase III n=1 Tax=Aerophobetes bacterium TaxID=2030807 RepID=A0A2A4X770_UNCAE|nr:MAG: 3-oxoacyl-ACP synthase [Candidatus Aerophobetes bacterium]
MKSSKQARIVGLGSYLPTQVLSNADLEKKVDTTDEWIVTRTGMKERRIAAPEESASSMGCLAAKAALDKAGMSPDDVDLILVATLTPDYIFPSTACLIQSKIGAGSAAAMDIQAACSGYIYGLSTAKAFIESGTYKNVLVVATEKLSSIVDYEDRNTSILFGDGATACVISDKGEGFFIGGITLCSDGKEPEILILPAGGSKNPATIETVKNKEHFIKMKGKELFKYAVRMMEDAVKKSLEKVGLTEEDISYLVPHQANIRIIDALARRFKIGAEKIYLTIHKYGNTSASSVGIALDELCVEKELKEGDNVVLCAFGAGLTAGAVVLTKGAVAK